MSSGFCVWGFAADTSYLVFIVIYIILIFVKLYIIKGLIGFPVAMFYKETLYRIIPVSATTCALGSLPYFLLGESVGRMLLTIIVSTVALGGSIIILGLEKSARKLVYNTIAS